MGKSLASAFHYDLTSGAWIFLKKSTIARSSVHPSGIQDAQLALVDTPASAIFIGHINFSPPVLEHLFYLDIANFSLQDPTNPTI